MRWGLTLRSRLVVLVLIVTLPALALALYSASVQRAHAVGAARSRTRELVDLASVDESELLANTHQLLDVLVQLPEVIGGDGPACSRRLAVSLAYHRRFLNLGAARLDGGVFCSAATPLTHPVNASTESWFRRALESDGLGIGDYQRDGLTGKPTVIVGHVAVDAGGRTQGVVFAALDLDWISRVEFAIGSQLPPDSTFTKLDANGLVLSRFPDPETWVGRVLPDHPLVRAIRAGESQATLVATGLDGHRRLYAFDRVTSPVYRRDVFVALGIPEAAAFADVDRLLRANLLGLGVAVVLALAAAWVGVDALLTRRLNAILAATRRLARGDLTARTGVRGQGEVEQLASAFDDMAQSLQEVTRRQALILESAGEGIYGLDLDGRITFANPAVAAMSGHAVEELIGRPSHDLLHHSRSDGTPYPAAECPIQATLRDGVGSRATGEICWRRDGSSFPAEFVTTPIREGDRLLGAVVVVADVTERRRAEEEMARQRETLFQSEKLAAMGEMLAGVAHELNNPLAVVKGRADLLLRKAGGPLARDAQSIAEAATRCTRIVRNFLALARQHPPERALVSLSEVVRGAVELLAYNLRVDDVAVTLDLDATAPPLWADAHQLQQVLVNLVTNAHHALRATAPPRRITIATRHLPAQRIVRLDVADTGPGIPPEIRARIFEPFFTTKPVGEGTGLGLALCRGIVESHGGRIDVESEPGRGARFEVELPAGVPAPARARATEGAEAPPVVGLEILVVDDEPEIVAVLAELLALDDHRTHTAANGRAALEALRVRRFDVVLSDVKMPELDGPGLYRAAAAGDPALGRRFVFMTGDVLGPETTAFIERIEAPTLMKPLDLAALRRAVREAAARGAP